MRELVPGVSQGNNLPGPISGSGRFFDITSRRSGANLDMGVISDAPKIPDVAPIAGRFGAAFERYERIGR